MKLPLVVTFALGSVTAYAAVQVALAAAHLVAPGLDWPSQMAVNAVVFVAAAMSVGWFVMPALERWCTRVPGGER